MAIELTERLLMDAGGWQAVKHARALVESGQVISAAYLPPILKGVVKDAGLEVRAGLKIRSASDVENICTCRQSREYGAICPHSLAVGLAVLRPRENGASPAPKQEEAPAPASKPSRFVREGDPEARDAEPIVLSVILPPQFLASWERGNLTLGVEVERKGRRALIQSLDPKGKFRCSEADHRLLDILQKIGPGAMSGMLTLNKEALLGFLDGLQGHPRVTLGRANPVHVSAKPLRPQLEVKSNRDGQVSLHVEWPTDARLLMGDSRAWALQGAVFSPVAPGLPAAYLEVLRRDIVLPAEQGAAFLQNELPGLRSHFEVTGEAVSGNAPRMIPEPGSFSLSLEGSLNHLTARLQRIYSRQIVTVGLTQPL